MNIPLALAAAISGLTIFIHVLAGGPDVHAPLLASELSVGLKAIISVIWHAVTAIMLVNTLALAHAARNEKYRTPLTFMVSAQYVLWSGLFIFYGLSRLGSLWPMPQWIIFLAISALALYGLRTRKIPVRT